MTRTHKHLWPKVTSLGNQMQTANLAMRDRRSLAPVAVNTAAIAALRIASFPAIHSCETAVISRVLKNPSFRPR